MVKTIKQLADELGVSKQTIQYHYQRLPTKDQQKDSQGKNLISPLAESIVKNRISKSLLAKNQQNDSKEPTKTSKGNNDLVATLRREVEDLKSQRDKQLATKDRQIDHLTKLLDHQQQLQLTTVTENKELQNHVQKLSELLETSKTSQKPRENNKKEDIHENKPNKGWWHFWQT
ncbi:DUF536 domain-containing protein [Lentilactobacillus sp. TOM.63]|uniref:DUF536 domain-containing protein n=1 Tax=Lentilactobacillus sp. TOM.63 TaxID=3055077 RepID=UPI0025A0B0BC|nr:DUF536 domain-containing protein [Lentilactobacillus sp. TOM.63]MDM7517554.1 DUF536 domain-containing protein [Lentilactobacillus sp. TOM.63]